MKNTWKTASNIKLNDNKTEKCFIKWLIAFKQIDWLILLELLNWWNLKSCMIFSNKTDAIWRSFFSFIKNVLASSFNCFRYVMIDCCHKFVGRNFDCCHKIIAILQNYVMLNHDNSFHIMENIIDVLTSSNTVLYKTQIVKSWCEEFNIYTQ